MGSLALLIAPTVVFLVFVVPYMSANVSPVFWVVRCGSIPPGFGGMQWGAYAQSSMHTPTHCVAFTRAVEAVNW